MDKEDLAEVGGSLQCANAVPGEYLGALYDIGFDRPEAHAIQKSGKMYYAFCAAMEGPDQLRGPGGQYRSST
jgi:alpha-galactosidase